MQVMGAPTDAEDRRDAPEVMGKVVVGRIRIVVDRVRARVVVIDAPALIYGDFLGLIVGYVEFLRVDRINLDHPFVVDLDDLVFIAFQIAGESRAFAKFGNGANHFGLLHEYGLAEPPGPVEVVVHQR